MTDSALPRVRRFRVSGMKPAHGRLANEFLKRCDLGIEGAFVPDSCVIRIELSPTVTDAQLAAQPEKIVEAFMLQGWLDVEIEELVDDIDNPTAI